MHGVVLERQQRNAREADSECTVRRILLAYIARAMHDAQKVCSRAWKVVLSCMTILRSVHLVSASRAKSFCLPCVTILRCIHPSAAYIGCTSADFPLQLHRTSLDRPATGVSARHTWRAHNTMSSQVAETSYREGAQLTGIDSEIPPGQSSR